MDDVELTERHESITLDRVAEMVERRMDSLDDPGICLACGEDSLEGVEPDARGYPCESCGANEVMGAEEILLRLAV